MAISTPKRRAGFTLIEVSLAVVVGLLVTYGVILSYQMKRQSAGDAIARDRVSAAMGTIAQHIATTGSPPVSGTNIFAKSWANVHPDEKQQSPWGGSTGDPTLGVSEDPPLVAGARAAAQAPDITGLVPTNLARAGNLYYVSLQDPSLFASVTPPSLPTTVTFKGYVISIYDNAGHPWLSVLGGK